MPANDPNFVLLAAEQAGLAYRLPVLPRLAPGAEELRKRPPIGPLAVDAEAFGRQVVGVKTRPSPARRALLGAFALSALLAAAPMGCNRPEAGSPEAVADAFVDAYFRRADQEKAKEYTAFGATKMLEKEIADVKEVRDTGYSPGDASLGVAVERGARTTRGDRVRFAYVLRFRGQDESEQVKHADVELSHVEGEWKVVRLGVSVEPPPE